jgi:CubicO group peptidase (beta-lactamase class C family)
VPVTDVWITTTRRAACLVAAAGVLACAPHHAGYDADPGGTATQPTGVDTPPAATTSVAATVARADGEGSADVAAAGTNAAPSRRTAAEVLPQAAGFDALRFAIVDSVIEVALREGAAPGAALVVGRRGSLVRVRGYGRIDWHPASPEVTDSTLFDLASLTKPMGTATVAAQLVQEGRLGLDVPIHHYLSTWPAHGPHGQITARHLLAHSSGLPPGTDIWRGNGARNERIARLAALPVRHAPGARREYSDIGMILLGAILEEITGSRLDDLLRVRVFTPLAMHDTRFNPLVRRDDGGFTLQQIAPTEFDGTLRRTLVHGVVHDLNAWILDGVAGHAGLFSSARDMAVYGQTLLDGAGGRGTPIFGEGLFARWLQQHRAFDRPLGWDVPTGENSAAGRFFTSSSFGHTGFTGTSIWIDPERGVFVVLLTNRLNPTARNQRHVQLRRDLHDAVQLAIDDMIVSPRQ